jgi:hypothetical protein
MSDDFENEVLNSLGGTVMPDKKWKDANMGGGDTWKFQEEKVIEGVLVGQHTAVTKFGERSVYDVETPDHKKMSIWETAQIKRFFSGIEVGQEFKITYEGKKPTKNGQMVNSFKFQVPEL